MADKQEHLCARCGSPETYFEASNGIKFPLAVTGADGKGYYPVCQQHFKEVDAGTSEFKYLTDDNDSVR